MAARIKRKRGRPAHKDPPVRFHTSIPTSANKLLRALSQALDRPFSEVLAEAITAYARNHPRLRSLL